MNIKTNCFFDRFLINFYFFTAVISLIAFTLTACGDSSSDTRNSSNAPRGDALVRLINLSPDTEAADLIIDKKDTVIGAQYLEDVPYEEIKAEDSPFQVQETSGFITLIDSRRSFIKDKQFS